LQSQLESAEALQKIKQEQAQPLKTLLSWEAPSRIFFERSRAWYVIVSFLFMLGIAFATLTKEPLLIVALIALMFLIYLSSTIKPHLIKHEITNKGIKSNKEIWQWSEIKGFWMSKRGKYDVLIVDLRKDITPNRIMLILGTADPEQVVKLLLRHSCLYLNKKQIGEDFINVFTLGSYRPVTDFVDTEKPKQETQTPAQTTQATPSKPLL
jgi:hypothetical protein